MDILHSYRTLQHHFCQRNWCVHRLHLNVAQVQEFDETGWYTLTPAQKAELVKRAGLAPTRLQCIYDRPDGEVAELGYNLALKTAVDEVEVLHRFLVTDEAAARKHQQDQVITASVGTTSKLIPEFAIDSQGRIWRYTPRSDFQAYVAANQRRILINYFYMPTSMPSTNTVAAQDALRQLTNFSKQKNVPDYVITRHGAREIQMTSLVPESAITARETAFRARGRALLSSRFPMRIRLGRESPSSSRSIAARPRTCTAIVNATPATIPTANAPITRACVPDASNFLPFQTPCLQ